MVNNLLINYTPKNLLIKVVFTIISKEKGFSNKIKDMAYIVEPLESLIPVNLILYTKISYYYIIKRIIYSRIIANKGANISYNSIIFKDRAESFLLI